MLTTLLRSPAQRAVALFIIPLVLLLMAGCGSSDKKNAKPLMTVDEALEKGLIDQMEALRQREISRLDIAIYSGARYRAAELIWEGGVDLNSYSYYGRGGGAAIHRAAIGGDVGLVELLVSAGANINSTRDAWGRAPMHVAAEHGQLEVLKTLVALGANVNYPSKGGRTPLDHARGGGASFITLSREARSKMVDFLLSKGAKTGEELKAAEKNK